MGQMETIVDEANSLFDDNLVLSEEFFEPVNVVVSGQNVLIVDKAAMQVERRKHAPYDHLRQCTTQAHDAFPTRAAVHDELADQRVIVRRDAVSGIDGTVEADIRPTWCVEICDQAR